MPLRSRVFAALLLCEVAIAIAPSPTTRATEPPDPDGRPTSAEAEAPWVPPPGSREALEALWKAKPFELDPATLSRASGGTVPLIHEEEVLLDEMTVHLNGQGGSDDAFRFVWRILSDDPDQTITWQWAPWRQEKPRVRARVVSSDGTETRLDPSHIVEGEVVVDELQISDVHELQIPLPNVKRGSVVEFEVTVQSTRAVLDGAGRMNSAALWSAAPVRKRRFRVEAPDGVPLRVQTVGVGAPPIQRDAGVQRVELEVGELAFRPYQLTQEESVRQAPSFGWSSAVSWNDVAVRYRNLIQPVMLEKAELKPVRLPAEPTTVQKVQAVMRSMRDRLRYTAVNLGDGAIVPTRQSVVLQRGYGDCKDLSVLMVAALRELGVNATVALTVVDDTIPPDELPGIEAFNHMVVVVRNGSERLWVDPTAPDWPVGVIPPEWRDQRALIIDPTTQGLVKTPAGDETRGAYRVLYDLRLSPFGFGDATVTSSGEGAGEGKFRSQLSRCDEAEARELLTSDLQPLFGDAPYVTRVAGCLPGEGTVVLTADYKATRALDTTDQSVTISLPSRVPDDLVPEAVRGKEPGSDQRDDASRKEEQRRNQERDGLTTDESENIPFKFEGRISNERLYRLTLPKHFVATVLPASRITKLGPSTLTEKATRIDSRTVEVLFRYEMDKTDWSVDDVRAFRAAYWKRYQETVPTLVAKFEPSQLIEENRTPEAVELMRKWLAKQPDDAVTRARFARKLLQLGMNEAAQDEAAHAWKDAPDDPLVNVVRGDCARYDRFGLFYRPPFDRAKAIESFRKALTRVPDHNWTAVALADTLRRNERGEIEIDWTPDVAAGAAVLQGLLDRGVASEESKKLLAEMYSRGRRFEELRKLFHQDPASRNSTDSNTQVLLAALNGGADAAMAAVRRADTPQAGFARLAMAVAVFAMLDRYDEARSVVREFQPGPGLEKQMTAVRAMAAALRPVPGDVPLHDPVSGARAVVALAAHASTPSAFNRELTPMVSSDYGAELDAIARRPHATRVPKLEPRLNWIWLYHGGTCTTVAAGRATRVRCAVPENPDVNLTTYWTQDGDVLRLESLGTYRQLAARAHNAATANRLDEAAGWINWYLDLLMADKNEGTLAQLLRDYWGQASRTDPDAVRLAAALASVFFWDMPLEAGASVFDDLERGTAKVTGGLKRRLDVRIAEVRQRRKEFRIAIDRLRPVAESENDASTWSWLSSLEEQAGLLEQASKRVDVALAADPRNVEWGLVKSAILNDTGRYVESVAVLERLRSETGADTEMLTNNLLWARLLAGQLDDDSERDARRMTAEDKKNVDWTALHTAAMVLVERGRVQDAAQLNLRLQYLQRDKEMTSGQWLLRGRLLSLLGCAAQSTAAYAHVTQDDPETRDLLHRFQGTAANTGTAP